VYRLTVASPSLWTTNLPWKGHGYIMLSGVYAVVMCLSVSVTVTLRYCIKTAKRRITQIMPHDRPGTSFQMGCFVVAEFLLTSASRSCSAIAELLVDSDVPRPPRPPYQIKVCDFINSRCWPVTIWKVEKIISEKTFGLILYQHNFSVLLHKGHP